MENMDTEKASALACDHAAYPRNYGRLGDSSGYARITGPCGDTMEFWLFVRGGTVEKASFMTDGCASSLACGSMTTVLVTGKSVNYVMTLKQEDILNAFGTFPPEFEHCALLAVNTIKASCSNYVKGLGEMSRDSTNKQKECEKRDNTDSSAAKPQQSRSQQDLEDKQKLENRLSRIKHKIVVLSGKGGVGKSTVAVSIAATLMSSGKRIGLLDIDIHGPSIPTMLGLEGMEVHGTEHGFMPVQLGNMKVMSLGFLLKTPDDAVIWRGPIKMGVIKQFLKDVFWGDLDFLIIDSPPETGDELLSVCQLISSVDGAVIVTTPQKLASVDVRKSINFCRQLKVPVLGIVENMSGFVCPKCGEVTQILCSGGGRKISEDMDVPFLGSIPIDSKIAEACDTGVAFVLHYPSTPTAGIIKGIVDQIAAVKKEINTQKQ